MGYVNSKKIKRSAKRAHTGKPDADRLHVSTIETVYPQGVTTRIVLSHDEIATKDMSKAELAKMTLHPGYFIVLDGREMRVSSTTFETVNRTLMSQAMSFDAPNRDSVFGRGTQRPVVIVNGVRKGGRS